MATFQIQSENYYKYVRGTAEEITTSIYKKKSNEFPKNISKDFRKECLKELLKELPKELPNDF